MNAEQMYVAGQFVPARDATISANDAGLLLGAGLFETLRVYNKKPFRLAQHLERLRGSGEFLRIFPSESPRDIERIIDRLLELNGLTEARVRITATRGPLMTELEDDEAPHATVLISAGPMVDYPREFYEQGATVVVSDIRANETDPAVYHKTTGYTRNLLALRDAHRARATEAVLFNMKNHLAGAAMSNVFLVAEGKLLTPPVEEGLLAGITRATVLELAAAESVFAEQGPLTIRDLLDADEVFLTNSIMELLPVCRVERKEIGEGRPGPVWKRLAEAYKACVTRETAQ
jgi:branched-chain amino acid aminotransferase